MTVLVWRLGYLGWALIGLLGPSQAAVGLVLAGTAAGMALEARADRREVASWLAT